LRLTTTHATNQPDTKDEGHIGLFCLSEIFLYIYKERERERYGSGATKRDIRARVSICFFFLILSPPGNGIFSLKEEKPIGKREKNSVAALRAFLRTRNDRKSTAVGRQNDRIARTFGLRWRLSFGRPRFLPLRARAISFFFCSPLVFSSSLSLVQKSNNHLSLSPSAFTQSLYKK